jgi:DNA (cytosine-5)-methyltransferase 1
MEQAGHNCIGWIEWDKFARRSYQAIYNTEGEYNAKDIQQVQGSDLPDSDVWCFGFPCQDVSVAGKQAGIRKGTRSGLFFEVIRLLEERTKNKQALPKYLFAENVKNLLSIDGGWGFARMQIELDQAGYNIEWSVIDSAEVVPQHRERIFIVGHLRGASTRKVFPIQRENGHASEKQSIKVVGNTSKTGYRSHDILDENGISKTITASEGVKVNTLVALHNSVKQIGNIRKTNSFGGNPQTGRVYSTDGLSPTLNTMQGGGREPKILVEPCLTPDRLDKRQHGRRFKNDGEPSFTLTAQDRHGALLSNGKTYAIRKLTPRECWRLQGFADEQFDKAKDAGVSNTQLYKQAGNSVTVPVIKAIAERF